MRCKKCGFEYDDGDKFCFNCGEPIPQNEKNSIANSGSAKSKPIVVGIILAAVVVLGAVIIAIVLGSGNKKLLEESTPSSIQSTPAEISTIAPQTTSTTVTTTTKITTTTAQTTVPVEEPEVDNTIPMNIRADNCGQIKQIQVTWNNVDGATQYLVSIFDGDKLIRTECVSEPKCVVTGLEDGKQYEFKVQSFVDLKWSENSDGVTARTISRESTVVKELNDYLSAQQEDEENKIQPIFGTGDLFCTVGDYEIHVKKEESFSGDTTYLGVYNKALDEWTIPYTTDSEFLTDGRIDIDEFMAQRDVGKNTTLDFFSRSTIVYEGGTVISCQDYISTMWNYHWFYDFCQDKLLCLYRIGSGDWEYLYNTSDELILYDYGSVTAINWNSGEERDIVEGKIKAVLEDSILVDIEESPYSSDDDHLALVNYNGEILIDLSKYKTYAYSNTRNTSYNGDRLLTIMYGEDSGIYACLINKDASFAFEPIKLYKQSYKDNKDMLYLFDDFFVIVRCTEGDPEQGIYFYELDGSQITRIDLE